MFFRSLCAKLKILGPFSAQQSFFKAFPFSTSSIFQAKLGPKKKLENISLEPIKAPVDEKQLNTIDSFQSERSSPVSEQQNSKKSEENNPKFETNKTIPNHSTLTKNTTLSTSNHITQTPATLSFTTNENKESNDIKNGKKSTDLVAVAVEQLIESEHQEWDKLRNFVLENERNRGKYNVHNLDASVIGYCMSIKRLDLAHGYFQYLKEQTIKPNLATCAKYLKVLYYRNYIKCSKKEEEEILELYKDISEEYPILELNTLNSLILALSVTREWKKTLALLEDVKKLTIPSKAAYSAAVAALFRNKEDFLAWSMLDEMLDNDKLPESEALLTYLKKSERLHQTNLGKRFKKLFNFFKNSEMRCPEDVAQAILDLYKKKFKTEDAEVKITLDGYCNNCRNKLEKSELTETEFEQLKQKFMKNVILGKDLFLKTDPQELSKFKDFLENMQQFDVVLDGLNIAYSTGDKNPQVHANLLKLVVQHYREKNKTVLVLGRVHMKNWPKDSWKYILENSDVFLTRNISQDDPYLLYCALNSGKNTIIVTRDLMRSHKFLLKDVKLKKLFQKWLDQRQHVLLTIGRNGQPIFKKPPDFCPIAQKNGEIWHIPIESSIEGINVHFHKTWLCLNLPVVTKC